MNLGIVVPGFSESDHDWCIPALRALVERLSLEHRVRVFALRYPFHRSRYRTAGAEVVPLGGAGARSWARLPLLGRALRTIAREHRREPFDVLHGIWADEPGWVAVRAARKLGLPSVVTLLGGECVAFSAIGYGGQLSRLNRRLVAFALRGADRVTAGSTTLARLGEVYAGVERLPIGVDVTRFCPGVKEPGFLEGAYRLLHVASLVPVKDQATLLRALSRLSPNRRGVVLHVVGDGPSRAELEQLAVELDVSRRVRFHGAVPHDRLPSYYRSAHLCVLSSLHEGQEWVTQEAAACARPTVGTRVGVVADLEPATVAVPPGDDAALARALSQTLFDETRLLGMGARARRKIASDYSLSVTLQRLGKLYCELVWSLETRYRRRSSFKRSRSATISMEKPA